MTTFTTTHKWVFYTKSMGVWRKCYWHCHSLYHDGNRELYEGYDPHSIRDAMRFYRVLKAEWPNSEFKLSYEEDDAK